MTSLTYSPDSPSGLLRSGKVAGYKHGRGYWIARWRKGGKTKERHFSCNKYGEGTAKSLASDLRERMIRAPSEGYSERHGRKE